MTLNNDVDVQSHVTNCRKTLANHGQPWPSMDDQNVKSVTRRSLIRIADEIDELERLTKQANVRLQELRSMVVELANGDRV